MRTRTSMIVVAALIVSLAIQTGTWWSGTAAAQVSAAPVVITSQQTSYGTVLFSGDGKALYVLTFDTAGTVNSPASSSCTGMCAGAWPPLLAPAPGGPFSVLGGVQLAGLATIQRPEGTYQVTYFGHPLYGFVGDKAAGQTAGENVAAFSGMWYLVTATGQPAPGVATVTSETTADGPALAAPVAFGGHRSLYMITADAPGASICVGGCARFWPPLLTSGLPVAGAGANPAGIGTLQRADGSTQVTYFGMPLYMFTFDLAAGAASGLTNGHKSVDTFDDGIWYLVSPAGWAQPGSATITAGTTPLGTILEYNPSGDPKGDTYPIYAFSADTPTGSACVGLCARIWTPVITSTSAQAASGTSVSQSSLGTIQRLDGTLQVTYNGHPLYLFAKDFAGTSGQGITAFGGTWALMQSSGVPSPVAPAVKSVVAVPQLSKSTYGVTGEFIVSFTTQDPGRGMVLFGSGPGCSGLVEVATQDSGSGTTKHSVTITGNDMAGSIGNNGVQPGATYYFEVATVTATGVQTDNNGGQCYSVTIPSS